MGVTGLLPFMCERGVQPVIRETIDFVEEIELWQAENGRRPKLIIDLKEITHMVVQHDHLGLFLGGRYGTHLHFFRKFFDALKQARVELVFFAMGDKLKHELSLFIPHQNEKYEKHLRKLDGIEAKDGAVSSFRTFRKSIRAPLTMQYNILKLAREYGELHINYVRHNQEIAKYLQQHDGTVLAIITNDKDFMVFDGGFQFWQANDVNMQYLTGVRMCRQNLRARLDLNSKQLHLVSALSGSMYLRKSRLSKFYRKIQDNDVGNHYIAHLANYVRSIPIDDRGRYDVAAVARDVFGEDCTEQDLNAIEMGIAQYDLNFSTTGTTKHITRLMELAKSQNMFIYKLLTDDVHLVTDIAFIDFRNYRSKNYSELVIPLLRKMHGILLENEFRRPRERAICMKYSHDETYKVQNETIVYPPMKLPDLSELIFQTKVTRYDTTRWALLQWLFDFGMDFIRSIKRVNKNYVAALVTIKYLLQQEEITIEEADAFLTTEMYTATNSKRMTKELPRKLNSHYIRIAHLYAKMYCLVCHCIEVCGLSELTNYLMFDGQFFHNTLDEFTSCPDKKSKAVERILPYRIYF